jgi:hypothetical protein
MKIQNGDCRAPSALGAFVVALASLSACASCHAAITIVAYEGFDYSAGSLDGQNGGTGWTSNWSDQYTFGPSHITDVTGMSYAGLTSVGGRMTWQEGGNGINQNTRTLPLVDSGVVYFQFLSQLSESGGGTPNIRLYNSNSLTGGFGGNGGISSSVSARSLLSAGGP